MDEYREYLLLIYFSCLFFNVWLVEYYKCFYLFDIIACYLGSLLITYEPIQDNNLSDVEDKRPCKKRKLSPIFESDDNKWLDEYWTMN